MFISDERIKLLLGSCEDEAQLRPLFHYLSHSYKTNPNHKETGEMLFSFVDESEYDLPQWIEAIAIFHQWLTEKNRTTTFPKMLGYISCCTQSPENKMLKYQLKDILNDMLKTHGYVG
ncbi:hypothetical protein M900_0373 [Bacteriovorax sp. Seq25_V]|nr:hypothetical protein M900_0373 [Bacteriovorax sp. Seq25_V]